MDRDKRWERTKLAYDAMVHGVGAPAPDPLTAIRAAYQAGETDEFVKPRVITGTPRIRSGDGVFCFNFRADRMRQIVRALAVDGFDGFDAGVRPKVDLVTMTQYDETFPFPVAFAPAVLSRIVAQVLSERGKTMFRTAETEKYAHVTYFFNGGVETPYPGEERVLVASQKVPTYDLMPEMSAPGVTDVLCNAIEAKQHDFILCNYANGDMVGHSGVLSAAVKAVEVVDGCLTRVLGSVERGGAVLLSVGPTVRLSVAQTGHEPGQSPYRDIRGGGVVVFGVGYLGGSRGRAGVGMADGISWNVRYDASLGGPVSTSLGLAYAQ